MKMLAVAPRDAVVKVVDAPEGKPSRHSRRRGSIMHPAQFRQNGQI